ncbi:hypothetical protein B0H12DRAFT_775132 [Mycena haematopus]|nr:hypothetical protein B0H12DRAFT_775132 [Mycena haematopus]
MVGCCYQISTFLRLILGLPHRGGFRNLDINHSRSRRERTLAENQSLAGPHHLTQHRQGGASEETAPSNRARICSGAES